MSEPPHDLGVDPDDDQDMANAKYHDQDETDAKRHALVGAPIPPFARHSRPDTRYRMELGNQLSEFIVEAGIRPAHYRDIEADDKLLRMWRGMSRDRKSVV